uniref:Uncharacterized protein n=1 Tax=Arundo donax TaxID=35708 RepID=A0A0A9ABK8_ARUDO
MICFLTSGKGHILMFLYFILPYESSLFSSS